MIPKDIRSRFPLLSKHPDLVYLDSAATTPKPQSVIDKEVEYYEQYGANIARGLYPLSEKATAEYEKTREMTKSFLNAKRPEEIIFTRGTTESINLLSRALEACVKEDDEILVTVSEHHSNFLPWQALAERKKAKLQILPIEKDGTIAIETLTATISSKTGIFAFPFVSNVLGTINPVATIAAEVKRINPETIVILDAAQAPAHLPIDVQKLGCDFLAFSAHKMFGPTGVGVLWGKLEYLNCLPPFHYGGEMVLEANSEKSVFKKAPHKFEAGTPNIAGVIAFQEALRFVQSLGFENIRKHELATLDSAITQLKETFGDLITIFGTKNIHGRSGVIAFSLTSIHPHDIAQMLGEKNICIRAGAHCAMPLHASLGCNATARLSVSVFTTTEDIDKLVFELRTIVEQFTR